MKSLNKLITKLGYKSHKLLFIYLHNSHSVFVYIYFKRSDEVIFYFNNIIDIINYFNFNNDIRSVRPTTRAPALLGGQRVKLVKNVNNFVFPIWLYMIQSSVCKGKRHSLYFIPFVIFISYYKKVKMWFKCELNLYTEGIALIF